jgi:hypothetical protein
MPGGMAIVLGVLLAAGQLDIPVFDVPDTVVVEARRQWMPRPQVSLLYESLRPSLRTPGLLKVPNSASFPTSPPTIELTRLGRIAYGADAAGFAGLSVGALGSWCGLWEERKAWYLMGAGAALGAIWGGVSTGKNSRVQIRATASPPAP